MCERLKANDSEIGKVENSQCKLAFLFNMFIKTD